MPNLIWIPYNSYVCVRTKNAGVFFGYVREIDNELRIVTLASARRIWYWDGACTLSELATNGTSKPYECKFPIEVEQITLYEVIEIIKVTEKAKQSIANVPIWTEFRLDYEFSDLLPFDDVEGYGYGMGEGCGSGFFEGIGEGSGYSLGGGSDDGSGLGFYGFGFGTNYSGDGFGGGPSPKFDNKNMIF
jgi:hypothetical protein